MFHFRKIIRNLWFLIWILDFCHKSTKIYLIWTIFNEKIHVNVCAGNIYVLVLLQVGKRSQATSDNQNCLATAQYCPLPGQFLAIARHKTICRERKLLLSFQRKTLLSFSLFTLHQFAWNPDKHWGCERWRVVLHSSQLFTSLHLLSPSSAFIYA